MFSLICLYFLPFLNLATVKETLPAYESFGHFEPGKYTTQYKRTFDEHGVVMQDRQYQPLTICIFGIMSYDAFMTTGDSAHYYNAVNQYAYFADTTHLSYSDSNQSVGLPYNYTFHDMNPPWFSGMTQGTAVSYLLRYYALTKNTAALELSKKLMHLLLKKEFNGGTIGRTPEGGMWIEEYPISRQRKSVMNGFINGWIGVYEYCLLFPDDRAATTVRDSCYLEMISNVHRYDTPDWTLYSRDGLPVSNSYMRYQLEEFDHLYSLVGDIRLRNQMRIWSRQAMGKSDEDILFLKHPQYEFAMHLNGNAVSDSCVFYDAEKFAAGLVAETPDGGKRQQINYTFGDARYYCEIRISGGDPEKNKKIVCSAQSDEQSTALCCTFSDSMIIVESDAPFNELRLRFPSQGYRRKCTVDVNSYSYRTCALPLFAFTDIQPAETLGKRKTYRFEFAGYNLTNATVFYRYAKTRMKIENAKFTLQQSFPLNGGSFETPVNGTYEFFISYDIMHARSALSKLKLVMIE